MLNHTLFNTLRTSTFRLVSADNAARKLSFENVKFRKLKYKSAAKERKKERIRNKMGVATAK